MKILVSLAALALVMGVSSAQAEGKKQSLHDQFTGQGYGTAGCGLGSVVFGESPGMIQIVAATINNLTWQSWAISSGTSNCGESGKVSRANQFIEANKIALENDLARGTGESLAALSEVMGCKNTDFQTSLRKSYSVGATNEQLAQSASQVCKL